MEASVLEKETRTGLKKAGRLRVAIVGNPNSGKTSLFNALTGLKHKIGNFPGVTVERKSGTLTAPDKTTIELIDLPGLYSLNPRSHDELIAADILCGTSPFEQRPDAVIVVADATNLQRCLYLCTQVVDLGYPVFLALNMMDLAEKQGLKINIEGLSRQLGIPVFPVVAKKQAGIAKLKMALFSSLLHSGNGQRASLFSTQSHELAQHCEPLVRWFKQHGVASEAGAFAEALRVVSQPELAEKWKRRGEAEALEAALETARRRFQEHGIPYKQAEVRIRYAAIDQICAQNITREPGRTADFTEKLDRLLTHKIFGPILMIIILATIFQSIYVWAEIPMDAIENGTVWLAGAVEQILPPGPFRDMLVEGAIAGVGAVLVFLPQIVFLFFFLAILEDTGYLARVAFIMDRFMARIGLSGGSVIPLLSSFACAIPGIMAARTLQNERDRLITILIAPFMSCSARLPVYTLMIGTFFPDLWFGGIFYLPGLILLSMYLLGIFAAVVSATVLQKWVIRGKSSNFIMELPVYRTPIWRFVFIRVYDAGKLFVLNAGKIILAVSIVLWFLASYPKHQPAAENPQAGAAEMMPAQTDNAAMQQIRQSYAGKIGHFIEPVIAPLGFDWKIGIGLITSFAAREVIVSTLATIYNVQDADETSHDLRQAIQSDIYPDTGKPVFTPLVALSLMVFFVLACQCMSTLAVVRKETGTWRWPVFMFTYMLVLAYLTSFVVYQTGSILGLA